jgi:hypothetical protein
MVMNTFFGHNMMPMIPQFPPYPSTLTGAGHLDLITNKQQFGGYPWNPKLALAEIHTIKPSLMKYHLIR